MTADDAKERGCALVTGSSRGLGAAIAQRLAADGWAVGVNYKESRDAAEALVEAIRDAGGTAVAIAADVGRPEAADELCDGVEAALDRQILVLVNNAGAPGAGLSFGLTDEAWKRTTAVNLDATFRLTRRALRPMLRARFGRVINVATAATERVSAGQAGYVASKAGVVGLTKAVAVEVARRSVTVNAIAPGVIDTDGAADVRDELIRTIPAGRRGTPAEVAACASFLASEEAAYVTGTVLTVDGGLTA